MVMLGEDIPKQLKSNGMLQCYPGMEESDDEDLDALAESYDVQMGNFPSNNLFVLCQTSNIFLCRLCRHGI